MNVYASIYRGWHYRRCSINEYGRKARRNEREGGEREKGANNLKGRTDVRQNEKCSY